MATLEGLPSLDLAIQPLLASAPRVTRQREIADRRPITADRLMAALETVIALAALAGVLIVTNLHAMPAGLDNFLSMRVTLRNVLLLAMMAVAWPLIFRLCGLYTASAIRQPWSERLRVGAACSLGSMLALVIPVLSRGGGMKPMSVVYFWLVTSVATLALREVRRTILFGSRTERRVLIVGTGPRARTLSEALLEDMSAEYEIAGYVDTAGSTPVTPAIAEQYIGTLDDLESILMHRAIDEVCVALPVKSQYLAIQDVLLVCERVGVRTKYQADLFNSHVAWPKYDEPHSPTVTMHVVPDDHRLTVKRLLDVVAAGAALVVLSPVMLIAAAAVKFTSPGPVFFAQERYGLNRRRFMMLKFRTMVADAERLQGALESQNEAAGPVFKIAADPRITRVGRLLRRTSIDELPQLFNILRGEMAIVGPRPLPVRDVRRFTRASDMRRFSVRPGLTCLWQVSGRSNLSFDEWITLDLRYIDGWSLALDFFILLRTVPAVIRGTGAQ
jgi:exopolysaccharide biosynthesis polyprenyl glycosylphosphotransferase